MADPVPLPHTITADDRDDLIAVTIGGPHGDKVLAEIRGVQRKFGLDPSEAVAMLIGYGIAAMTEHGLIGDRFSEPMSGADLMREMRERFGEG